MRYWWVSQKKTYQHEVPGNYLWSPKRKKDGARNPYYEFMREVARGDIIFSYAKGKVRAVGIAVSHAFSDLKPQEFGAAGAVWSEEGWRIPVQFQELPADSQIAPKQHMDLLAKVLPERYKPLTAEGKGLELYLTELSAEFAETLLSVIGPIGRQVIANLQRVELPTLADIGSHIRDLEVREIAAIRADKTIPETEREALIKARRGQGQFRKNVLAIEQTCRLTGVDQLEHLRASHCMPWRRSSNADRLDGSNGLMLTPNADHLFDKGLISFDDNGDLLISTVAHAPSLRRMGIDPDVPRNVGPFSERQSLFLKYHRDVVFLKAQPPKSKQKKKRG